jgi:FtsP/CotA-like multicopper oxidase with cupredoxin domain
LNGIAFDMATMPVRWHLRYGYRYRLRFRNASDDIHPIHMHRCRFELTRIDSSPTAGVMKDVVMLGGYQTLEFDFTADQPGRVLFHCHSQLHMDFGFMALFRTARRDADLKMLQIIAAARGADEDSQEELDSSCVVVSSALAGLRAGE